MTSAEYELARIQAEYAEKLAAWQQKYAHPEPQPEPAGEYLLPWL